MMVWAGFEFHKLGVTSESLWNRDIVISHSSGCFQIKKLSSWWGGVRDWKSSSSNSSRSCHRGELERVGRLSRCL